jgi:predicted nucleic-acid-binding protein
MIALDTNVLVRILTNDDPAQARRALARMRSETCWISRTVLLETEWVLRHAYGLTPVVIGQVLARLVEVASVEIEDRSAVLRALAWHAAGMDLADALHLAIADGAAQFVSFDRDLAKVSRRLATRPPVVAP